MTDGVHRPLDALEKVRAFATLTDDERADVQAAIWAYEHALKGRTG